MIESICMVKYRRGVERPTGRSKNGDAPCRNRVRGQQQSRVRVPPVDHSIVRTHPETGGPPSASSAALIDTLNWRPDDFMVWDKRCVLHRGRASSAVALGEVRP